MIKIVEFSKAIAVLLFICFFVFLFFYSEHFKRLDLTTLIKSTTTSISISSFLAITLCWGIRNYWHKLPKPVALKFIGREDWLGGLWVGELFYYKNDEKAQDAPKKYDDKKPKRITKEIIVEITDKPGYPLMNMETFDPGTIFDKENDKENEIAWKITNNDIDFKKLRKIQKEIRPRGESISEGGAIYVNSKVKFVYAFNGKNYADSTKGERNHTIYQGAANLSFSKNRDTMEGTSATFDTGDTAIPKTNASIEIIRLKR